MLLHLCWYNKKERAGTVAVIAGSKNVNKVGIVDVATVVVDIVDTVVVVDYNIVAVVIVVGIHENWSHTPHQRPPPDAGQKVSLSLLGTIDENYLSVIDL